jgi:hypothetical protein
MTAAQGDAGPTEYPKGWFPATDRAVAKRERDEVMREINGMSTEDLQRVLDEAKKGGTDA